MNTVGFIARAFRILIELVNLVAAFTLLVFIVFYVTRRDEIIVAASAYGYYSDATIMIGAAVIVVSYILTMGLLCTFIEIRSSLARLEKKLGEQDMAFHSFPNNQSEPKF